MIPKKETLQVEFKSDVKGLSDQELIEEVVAMANADGGDIYIGVEDDGHITGVSKKHLDVDGVRSLISNLTIPSVYVTGEILCEQDQYVLKIHVPCSTSIVSTSSGKTLQRRLRFDLTPEMAPLFPFEFDSRRSFLQQKDITQTTLFDYDPKMIDFDSVHKAMSLIKENNRADKTLLGLDEKAFLSSLGSVRLDEGGNPKITLAGLFLFGTKEALKTFNGTYGYSFQRLKGGFVQQNEDFFGNIIEAFERFREFSVFLFDQQEYLDNGVRYQVSEFDETAVREAFSNAIAHRDYSLLGKISVCLDEGGLRFTNPGSFIRGLNQKGLIMATPRGRNPLLSASLKRLGYCEETGRGIDRIYAGSARYGKRWPTYALSDEQSVTLVIPRSPIDREFASFVRRRCEGVSLIGLLALSKLREKETWEIRELSASLGIPEELLESYLDDLLSRSLVNKSGKTYSLDGVSAKEAPTKLASSDSKSLVLSHAKRFGEVASKDVQELLGVDGAKAYRLLKKLVEDGSLEQIYKGKYARYRIKNV